MARRARTEAQLTKAVNAQSLEIELQGDVKQVVIRIKAVGAVVWGVVIVALVATAALILSGPGVIGVAVPAAPILAALGVGATIGAAKLYKGGSLESIRADYDIEERGGRTFLVRKS